MRRVPLVPIVPVEPEDEEPEEELPRPLPLPEEASLVPGQRKQGLLGQGARVAVLAQAVGPLELVHGLLSALAVAAVQTVGIVAQRLQRQLQGIDPDFAGQVQLPFQRGEGRGSPQIIAHVGLSVRFADRAHFRGQNVINGAVVVYIVVFLTIVRRLDRVLQHQYGACLQDGGRIGRIVGVCTRQADLNKGRRIGPG